MLTNFKQDNGMITLEATISLSAFMFFIVTILTIVNICTVQTKISNAINTTAKEISQYSYLYSLTGLNDSQSKISEAGKKDTEQVNNMLSNINSVYNEIDKIGKTSVSVDDDIDSITGAWESVAGSAEKIKDAGSSLESSLSEIADNPKKLMFGIAKMAASEGFDLVKSRLIAAPLAKMMCKKHLVNQKDGDVNAYLKHLGVVPSGTGSYIDGLDFSRSSLFPDGSNEIRINVSYDVKVIALLPIDWQFHFNQTAVTHGWLAGDVSFKSADKTKYTDNDTLWTQSTPQERAKFIRHMVIQDEVDEGYEQTVGLTDVQLYNEENNEFVMISSMNPLYTKEGEPPMKIEDLTDSVLKESIEDLCGKIKSTTDGVHSVTTKTKNNDGSTSKQTYDCSDASNKIILVIPEDPGLKEKIESIIAESYTRGVNIEVVPSYGYGARQTETSTES